MLKLTKICEKIVLFLGNYPEKDFFSKEIAEKLDISLGGAHNSLKYLAKEKIIQQKQRGNMKFYRVNWENPLVKQIKITFVISALSPLLKSIKNYCLDIILFGSASRGEQTAESDIDLFILTHNPKIVKEKMTKLKGRLTINPIIKTPNQWSELEVKEQEFYNEVKQGVKL
ncbi:nucleotidyltransferase domain-containing protein [Patescibacteria group bacterium]|nr:nucleotidyltransferase domain-containing protein [Patescibacteria group bacterium]MCG2809430.1 nucleotidyltransferase domain-containing protein [Candidatus Portnoybacteria bacterium]